jgi:hypothetical protein
MFEKLANLMGDRTRRRGERVVRAMLTRCEPAASRINDSIVDIAPELATRPYWHERDFFLSIALYHSRFDSHLYSLQCEEARQAGGNYRSELLKRASSIVLEGWNRHATRCYQEYEAIYDSLMFETSEEMQLQSVVRLSGCGAYREKKLDDGTPVPAMGIWYVASVSHGRCLRRVGTGVSLDDYDLSPEDVTLARRLESLVESYEDE